MLEDCLTAGLRLVVVGTAAGTASARVRQYYAGPGNKFWRTLHEIGLTPRVLDPSEFKGLLRYGVGLTDLVKDQAGADSDIRFGRNGTGLLRHKVTAFRPRVVCFNGKRAAKEYFGLNAVEYGLQREGIASSRLFVAPSTSGAASGSWDVSRWQELAELIP